MHTLTIIQQPDGNLKVFVIKFIINLAKLFLCIKYLKH